MYSFPIWFAKVTLLALMWDHTNCALILTHNGEIECGVCQVAALDHGIEISDFTGTNLEPTGEKMWRQCGTLHPEMEVSCGRRCQVAKYQCANCQVLALVPLKTDCREHTTPPICYEDESRPAERYRRQQLALKNLGEKRKRGG
jgi:hypothetical protein